MSFRVALELATRGLSVGVGVKLSSLKKALLPTGNIRLLEAYFRGSISVRLEVRDEFPFVGKVNPITFHPIFCLILICLLMVCRSWMGSCFSFVFPVENKPVLMFLFFFSVVDALIIWGVMIRFALLSDGRARGYFTCILVTDFMSMTETDLSISLCCWFKAPGGPQNLSRNRTPSHPRAPSISYDCYKLKYR